MKDLKQAHQQIRQAQERPKVELNYRFDISIAPDQDSAALAI